MIIRDLAERIAAALTERHPEKWQVPNDPDPMHKTLATAINQQGWQPGGIPGVLRHICLMLESGEILAFSTFNGKRLLVAAW